MTERLYNGFHRLPMRSKVFVTATAMMVVADLLIVFFFPYHSRRMELDGLRATARSTAGMLAERLERGRFARESLDRFVEIHSEQVRFVVVAGPHAEEILLYNEDLARAAPYGSATAEGTVLGRARTLAVRSAVTLPDGQPGTLVLGYSTVQLEEHVAEVRWLSLGFAAVLLVVGAVSASFISRLMTRPLRSMAATVEQIATGDLSRRIDVVSDDEVGAIATAFNATVENLEFAYRELRTTIHDLEKKAIDLQHEVVQRQRAVDALRESEQRLRTLAGAAFEGIGITEDGIVIDANEQLSAMFGIEPEELVGRTIMDYVAPESRSAVEATIRSGSMAPYEHLALRKDGTAFPVEVRGRMLDFNGRILRVSAIRDITDQKQAEVDLRRAHEGLERKVEERTAELRVANEALQREIDERAVIARAKEASEERYRSLVVSIKDVVFQSDATGRLTFLNPSWTEMTGFSIEESLGRPFREFILEEDAAILEGIGAVLGKGQHDAVLRELRVRTRERGYRWIEVSARLSRSDQSAFSGVAGTMRDVTDLRDAERVLQESNEFVDRIVNSVGDPLFVKDRRHCWILMNDAMCSFMGHRREELLGKSDYEFFPKEEADVFWARDEEVFSTRRENINEEQFTDGAGVVHSIMTKKNLYTDDRSNDFIVGVIRDISLMKEAEREIRKLNEDLERRVAVRTYELQTANKELLREITERKRIESELRKLTRAVEQSPSSVVITDTRGNIEYVNPKFVQVTGYDPEEVLGRNPRLLKSGHTRPEEYKTMWETILSGSEWRGEFHNKKKSGELCWEAVLISPLKNAKGEVTHFIAVKEDITARKVLEAQFRRTQRLEIIGTLAGGIAHDLNNVLSPILMGIQILRMKVNDDKGRQVLTTIEASANRGADIVKQVLTFARGTEGEHSAIQVKHLIREIEEIIHETFPKGIDLKMQIPKDLWVVRGDATQLHQVLMNLCVNARDAMPEGGTLSIRAENVLIDDRGAMLHIDARKGPYILLTVSDSGTGIATDLLEKIFDPFFTTKELGKGTGLGLSTVLAIVKGHEGFVTVYSEMGKGTQFKVYLPAGESKSVGLAEVSTAETPRGNGELVLVVDDEVSVREITREILLSYGYEVLLARDGLEALTIFQQERSRIRVVVTDMMMPQMDGTALIHELHRIDPDVRIIAASGLTSHENSEELHHENVQAFLTKPYKAEKLLWVIDTVLK